MADAPYFSRAERDRRWARVRALMRSAAIDAIVVPPHTGHHDHFSANARYLTGLGGYSLEVGAVFPLNGAVTAITVPDVAPAKWRAQQDWVDDIRSSGRAFGDGMLARLKELRLGKARIGLAGWRNVPRFEDGLVPQPFYAKLVAEFPQAELVDCTRLLDRARYVKSAEEIDFLRRSTALAEAAIAAMHRVTRPGIEECAVYAAMLAAMVERGGEVPAMIMWSAGSGAALASAGPPLRRVLAAGDLLRVEVEGRYAGYCGQVTQMAVLGRLPEPYRDLWRLQQDALQACNAALRPGITLGELARRTEAVAAGTPCRIKFLMHGRGLGDDAPIYVFNAPDEIQGWVVEENASFIAKPVVSREGYPDIMWGDSIVVTPSGPQRLGAMPAEFTELG
ncbi:MAG TPA: M24 family metallopeptidase [Stellaceae bacterium]|jgi:Xaa-Pro aminopeptidase|nr:M24 family metallopeptidase [Stellaceae bacterium]